MQHRQFYQECYFMSILMGACSRLTDFNSMDYGPKTVDCYFRGYYVVFIVEKLLRTTYLFFRGARVK